MNAGFNRVVLIGSIVALSQAGPDRFCELSLDGIESTLRGYFGLVDGDWCVGDVVLVTGSLRAKAGALALSAATLIDRVDIVPPASMVEMVHDRGDVKEHSVRPHTRRLRSGRIIEVRPHIRGGKPKLPTAE